MNGSNLPRWVREGTIVDAKEPMTLNIRQRDIDEALPEVGDGCVIARCALRAFDAKDVFVFRGTAYVQLDEGGTIERFTIPTKMRRDVVVPLDDRRFADIVPGRYDLVPPSGSERLGEAVKRRKRLRENREAGLSLPAIPRPRQERKMVGRIRSAR